MSDRPLSDQEIEHVLRSQPRRMPSEAFWARVHAEAISTRPQPKARYGLVLVVGAVAVIAVAAFFLSRQTPPPVNTQPPQVMATRVPTPTVIPPATPKQELVKRETVPDYPQVLRVKHTPRVSVAPRRQFTRDEPKVIAPEHAEPVVQPVTPIPTPEQPESSYYLAVSHGNERSEISGSVIRQEVDGVIKITLAYNETTQTLQETN